MSSTRLAAIVSLDVTDYSKMMQSDAKGLLADLNSMFSQIVQPQVQVFSGRVVKLLGDGAILEFGSASDAIQCSAEIQKLINTGNYKKRTEFDIRLRAGIHVGDVYSEGNDIFGDAVNIAARLQSEAEPGGILLSSAAAALAGSGTGLNLQRQGTRRLKNIDTPLETLSVDLSEQDLKTEQQNLAESLEIKFCRSSDGQSLAWASVGVGKPIVKAPNWIGHLELDWRNPGMVPIFRSLSQKRRFVYFDARGNGLSDWDMKNITFELMVNDLEAVFDAAGIDRAPIVAMSQGCAIAAAFAARAPERVSSIVMIGSYPTGREKRDSEKDRARSEAMRAMMTAGWDDDYPSMRDLMAEVIVPGASREDLRQYAEDMRVMISPENLGRYREVIDNIDVTGLLSQVQCPCLVMHCRNDRMQPVDQGRKMAAGLANARFIPLDSGGHNIVENDPVWPIVEREMHAFLEAEEG